MVDIDTGCARAEEEIEEGRVAALNSHAEKLQAAEMCDAQAAA